MKKHSFTILAYGFEVSIKRLCYHFSTSPQALGHALTILYTHKISDVIRIPEVSRNSPKPKY